MAPHRKYQREERVCEIHGLVEFYPSRYKPDVTYWTCRTCASEKEKKRLADRKQQLVTLAGGACILCGYDRCLRALHFHHKDRDTKAPELSTRTFLSLSYPARMREIKKCVLLCANCHAEVESGISELIATPE